MATKKKTASVASLFDLVMSKSKSFIDKAKRPLLEKKAKREFKSMIDTSISELVDLKEETLELLTAVRSLDVPQIVENMEEMDAIKIEMNKVAEIYKLVFGEKLEMDLEEIDLGIDLKEVLGRVAETEEDENDAE
jgi:hypothetical protein